MPRILFIILFFLEITSTLFAHTVRPAYLEVTSMGKTNYYVKWKVPIEEKIRLNLLPIFPKDCRVDKDSFYKIEDGNIILSYWIMHCKEALLGKKITIENLKKENAEVLFYFKQDEISYFKKISASDSIAIIDKHSRNISVAKEYTYLGIKHILLGYDHLLFILGLLFIVTGFKTLIKTITAFTLAHSITLGLSILGYVVMNATLVEALIALSIVILAVEIIYALHGKSGLLTKYPWAIAFFFGLIHGFGFSSVLMELGLPQAQLSLALLFFNIGIEVGQLMFISLMISLYFILKKFLSREQLLKGNLFLVYAIGTIASYWLIERIT